VVVPPIGVFRSFSLYSGVDAGFACCFFLNAERLTGARTHGGRFHFENSWSELPPALPTNFAVPRKFDLGFLFFFVRVGKMEHSCLIAINFALTPRSRLFGQALDFEGISSRYLFPFFYARARFFPLFFCLVIATSSMSRSRFYVGAIF